MTVEYAKGVPQRVRTVVVAAQHDDVRIDRLQDDLTESVILPSIPRELRDQDPITSHHRAGSWSAGRWAMPA